MSARAASPGRCPRCGASIPRTSTLIEYETADGRATYAECPGCNDVVHPDRPVDRDEQGDGGR